MQLTVDTTLLYTLWKDQGDVASVRRIVKLAEEGRVDLAITARVRQDVPYLPYADRLETLADFRIDTTPDVWRLGSSKLDETMLGSGEFDQKLPDAQRLAQRRLAKLKSRVGCKGSKPPNCHDWDHLHAHMLLQRDYFVTGDCGILCIADWLDSTFGVKALTPSEALRAIVGTGQLPS